VRWTDEDQRVILSNLPACWCSQGNQEEASGHDYRKVNNLRKTSQRCHTSHRGLVWSALKRFQRDNCSSTRIQMLVMRHITISQPL
jgi:hypothetical protein